MDLEVVKYTDGVWASVVEEYAEGVTLDLVVE